MDLVNKQYIALIKIRKHCDEVARLFYRRARGYAHVYAHLVCYDGRQRSLAESRRAVQQDVVERLVAKARSVNENAEVILSLLLPYIFFYRSRSETPLTRILRQYRRARDYGNFLKAF